MKKNTFQHTGWIMLRNLHWLIVVELLIVSFLRGIDYILTRYIHLFTTYTLATVSGGSSTPDHEERTAGRTDW